MWSARRARLTRGLAFQLISGSLVGFLLATTIAIFGWSVALRHYLSRESKRELTNHALDLGLELKTPVAEGRLDAVQDILDRHALTRGTNQLWLGVRVDEDWVTQSETEAWQDLKPQQLAVGDGLFTWEEQIHPAHSAGVIALRYHSDEGFSVLIVEDQYERNLLRRQGQLWGAFIFVLVAVVGTGIGWLLSRRALKGVKMLGETADLISVNMNLKSRIQLPTGTAETDRVAVAMNGMLNRIRELVDFQKNTMDDIAHDVRSPVTRLRAIAEQALSEQNSEWAGRVIGECDHILQLVETLLEISAAESGIPNWNWVVGDPAEAIEWAPEIFEPLLEARNLNVSSQLERGLKVRFDPKVWQRVVANLMDNAIKFSDLGGQIELSLCGNGTYAVWSISNQGPVMDPQLATQLFDRFRRGEQSRSTRGSGLGLSFCKAAITSMGGEITCQSKEGCTRFTIRIPLVNHEEGET
ncbi:MAG: HAMP domain-containing histidine kinase [Acidobacteria bacterium]|nr:HAMP domain-containing histidine kinase [Acidobacteriota bacterium]